MPVVYNGANKHFQKIYFEDFRLNWNSGRVSKKMKVFSDLSGV